MKKLRGYSCHHYSYKNINGNIYFVKSSNTACWAGIKNLYIDNIEYIYIDCYKGFFEQKYIDKLVHLMNKITETLITESSNGNHCYIKYKLIGKYTKDLYLLNFIRYLWYDTNYLDNEKFFKGINGELKDVKCNFRDPLKRLNFFAINAIPKLYSGPKRNNDAHCGIYGSNTKIRSVKEFNAWNGKTSMSIFAMGEEHLYDDNGFLIE